MSPLARNRRPVPRPGLLPTTVEDEATTRALQGAAAAITRLELRTTTRAVGTVDLAVGRNTFPHTLGRTPIGATVTPTVADPLFAWAFVAAESDDGLACIDVDDIAQPGATVELF